MSAHNSAVPRSRLALIVEEQLLALFFLLLQQGVRIRRRVDCSVEVFLRQEIDADPGMIERIQSIMLDGKPVDDLGSSLVRDGSTLALSAAMPGLVGATLRRGGAYSSFRSGITYRETEQACKPGEGWVRVKVFNLLMTEIGVRLLRSGVYVSTPDLLGFFEERALELHQRCRSTFNDKPSDVRDLAKSLAWAGMDEVFMTITEEGPSADLSRPR